MSITWVDYAKSKLLGAHTELIYTKDMQHGAVIPIDRITIFRDGIRFHSGDMEHHIQGHIDINAGFYVLNTADAGFYLGVDIK